MNKAISGEKAAYLVLARKYRPQTFADLYGQDALVQTLQNAIQQNRIHHAYILTGIRGTGKTTSARIIAKALNCANGPASTWPADDAAAQSIAVGNHPDVLEFDAASHRGVEDIQDLFEGVAYAPVAGRYKVYIIDEVHMLSKQAFNALLKTLEEPPPNVVFIFATTEIQKVPMTILSRCMRFDLKRISVETLMALYQSILQQEGVGIDPAALRAIAKAADGSARDGLSLLDQAIALSSTGMANNRAANHEIGTPTVTDAPHITHATVQQMLGLVDRQRVIQLLTALTSSQIAAVLAQLDELYALGQDAVLLVNDLLSTVDMLTRLKVVPGLPQHPKLTELERSGLVPLAERLPLENLARLYQMLLQSLQDVKLANRPYEALSMAAVRITHLASLPPLSQLLQNPVEIAAYVSTPTPMQPHTETPTATTVPITPEPSPKSTNETTPEMTPGTIPSPNTWEGVIALLQTHKPTLAAVLVQQGRCVELAGAGLTLAVDQGLHDGQEVRAQVQSALTELTQQPWQVSLAPAAQHVATLQEQQAATQAAAFAEARTDPTVKQALEMFPGAEIVEILTNELTKESDPT